ncbi:hypothetical protein KC218_28465, partial [Mycobacterium tuberculosis]|nr:hypothetical protein [Mycobacterium tuberculosis]
APLDDTSFELAQKNAGYAVGGRDIFDKKNKEEVCFLRWGFPGKNRRIILKIPMNELKCIEQVVGLVDHTHTVGDLVR